MPDSLHFGARFRRVHAKGHLGLGRRPEVPFVHSLRFHVEFVGQLEQPACHIAVCRPVREPTTAFRLFAKESRLPACVFAVLRHARVNIGTASGIPSRKRRAGQRDALD